MYFKVPLIKKFGEQKDGAITYDCYKLRIQGEAQLFEVEDGRSQKLGHNITYCFKFLQ